MHEGTCDYQWHLKNILHPRLLSDCQCQSQLSYKRALPKKLSSFKCIVDDIGCLFLSEILQKLFP